MSGVETDALYETAFHEAGHAVVGFVLGLNFAENAITIIPSETLSGEVKFVEGEPQTRDDLCVTFSGLLAQSFTARTACVEERILMSAVADVQGAAKALHWMGKNEMWQVLLDSFRPPSERGDPYRNFRTQFFEALRQSHLSPPERIEGNPEIFLELHRAALSGVKHSFRSTTIRFPDVV